jgi:hypothetical protein
MLLLSLKHCPSYMQRPFGFLLVRSMSGGPTAKLPNASTKLGASTLPAQSNFLLLYECTARARAPVIHASNHHECVTTLAILMCSRKN